MPATTGSSSPTWMWLRLTGACTRPRAEVRAPAKALLTGPNSAGSGPSRRACRDPHRLVDRRRQLQRRQAARPHPGRRRRQRECLPTSARWRSTAATPTPSSGPACTPADSSSWRSNGAVASRAGSPAPTHARTALDRRGSPPRESTLDVSVAFLTYKCGRLVFRSPNRSRGIRTPCLCRPQPI